MGVWDGSIIFDPTNEESMSVDTSLLVAVNKQGEIMGTEKIGKTAKFSSIQAGIETVAEKAGDIFKYYGFN